MRRLKIVHASVRQQVKFAVLLAAALAFQSVASGCRAARAEAAHAGEHRASAPPAGSARASEASVSQDSGTKPADVDERLVEETLSELRALAGRSCPLSSEIEVLGPAVQRWDADPTAFPSDRLAPRLASPDDRLPSKEYERRVVRWDFCEGASNVSLLPNGAGPMPTKTWRQAGGRWYCFERAPGQPGDLDIQPGLSSDFEEVKLLSVFNGCVAFPSVISTRSLADHLSTIKCTMTQTSTDASTVRWESARPYGRVEIEVELRLADRRLRRLSFTQYRSADSDSDVPASKVVIHIDAWDETPAYAGLPRRAYIWSGSFATNEIDGVTVTPRLNYTELERIAVDAHAPCEDLRRVPVAEARVTVRDEVLRLRYTIGGTSLWVNGRTARLEKPIEGIITTELPEILEGRRTP